MPVSGLPQNGALPMPPRWRCSFRGGIIREWGDLPLPPLLADGDAATMRMFNADGSEGRRVQRYAVAEFLPGVRRDCLRGTPPRTRRRASTPAQPGAQGCGRRMGRLPLQGCPASASAAGRCWKHVRGRAQLAGRCVAGQPPLRHLYRRPQSPPRRARYGRAASPALPAASMLSFQQALQPAGFDRFRVGRRQRGRGCGGTTGPTAAPT